MEFLLPGRRESRHRASVERILKRVDDAPLLATVQVSVFSRELYRRLVALSARISEVDALKSGRLEQFLGELDSHIAHKIVADVDFFLRLLLDCLHKRLEIRSERVDRDSRKKVDVFLSVHVVHRRALTVREHDIERTVIVDNDF